MRWYGALFAAGGCSLIYNPNNITKAADAEIDSPADAAVDANANNLMLTDAFPKLIDEGQGDGNSRKQILVIHGTNFVMGAKVSLSAASAIMIDADNTNVSLAPGADYIAVPLTVHVDPGLQEGMTVDVSITVMQPAGGAMLTKQLDGQLQLVGHDELSAPPTGEPNAAYSRISFANAITISPGAHPMPYKLHAISSLTVGDVTAKGGNASSTTGGAGTSTCNGGGEATKGDCAGGGTNGTSTSVLANGGGGGGAGFATAGTTGTGGGAGAGGPMAGDDMISSYTTNVAAGGGGGGAGTLSSGGGGGGGGGTIELWAGGDLTCGKIDVTGGAGAASGSGGGGGAGGVILVRADNNLTTMMLTSAGGAGGNVTNKGGMGSPGRIRYDAPAGNAPAAAPTAMRGPSFGATQLVLASTAIQLLGTANRKFDVYFTDAAGRHTGEQGVSFDGSGKATINPTLGKGWNRVCITLQGGQSGTSEGDRCVDVAYLP